MDRLSRAGRHVSPPSVLLMTELPSVPAYRVVGARVSLATSPVGSFEQFARRWNAFAPPKAAVGNPRVEGSRRLRVNGQSGYGPAFRPVARPDWLNRFSSGRPPERGDKDQRKHDSADATNSATRAPHFTLQCHHIENYKGDLTPLTSRETP